MVFMLCLLSSLTVLNASTYAISSIHWDRCGIGNKGATSQKSLTTIRFQPLEDELQCHYIHMLVRPLWIDKLFQQHAYATTGSFYLSSCFSDKGFDCLRVVDNTNMHFASCCANVLDRTGNREQTI
jgi:hypothetical protein